MCTTHAADEALGCVLRSSGHAAASLPNEMRPAIIPMEQGLARVDGARVDHARILGNRRVGLAGGAAGEEPLDGDAAIPLVVNSGLAARPQRSATPSRYHQTSQPEGRPPVPGGLGLEAS
jgi:hypothetical protein